MAQNEQSKKTKTKEELTKEMQDAMREHYRKMETDEEYRKETDEFCKMFVSLEIEEEN